MKQQELLARKFVEIAKKFPKKVAFIDGVSGNKITYGKALIAALILKKKFDAYNHKKIGMMIPTSGGAIIALVAALFSGKIAVMINYSTGILKNSLNTLSIATKLTISPPILTNLRKRPLSHKKPSSSKQPMSPVSYQP